jgi:hypothetical protein
MNADHPESGAAPRPPMSESRVTELIDAYGADPLRWPDAERVAAEAELWRSPQLRHYQSEARALDQAMAAPPLVAVPSALRESLLRAAPRPLPRGPWQWLRALLGELGAPPRLLGPAIAGACALGIALGSLVPVDGFAFAAAGEEDVLSLAQFDEPFLLQALDAELELEDLP